MTAEVAAAVAMEVAAAEVTAAVAMVKVEVVEPAPILTMDRSTPT